MLAAGCRRAHGTALMAGVLRGESTNSKWPAFWPGTAQTFAESELTFVPITSGGAAYLAWMADVLR